MHDVDVVIEVQEKGKTVQMGRFNQGGLSQFSYKNQLKLLIWYFSMCSNLNF
ncbi:hypothetical protein SAMN05428988_5061 [Chitinophaga sp. YR573]|nr:hypothetical protein SAMN05428988_5061 [Chitinophaga sp. YR573]